jgi:asparagine synthase (glutamine-hydrolysing)
LRIGERELIGFLPEMVHLQDEPIADPVCVPLHFLSRLARDRGIKVCQIGEGSDELFFGYREWRRMLRLQSLADRYLPGCIGRLGLAALRRLGRGERLYTEYLRRATVGQPVSWGGADVFTDAQKHFLLSPRLRESFAGVTSWEALAAERQRFLSTAWEPSDLNWMTHVDLHFRIPELLLMRVDKMTMGAGLEAREPFLDQEVVRIALAIPTAVKTRGGTLKAILKRAIADLVPREIVERPKQGFSVPIQEWFGGALGEIVRNALNDFCRDADVLDRAGIGRLLAQGRGMQLWYLANLALWWRHFVAGKSIT